MEDYAFNAYSQEPPPDDPFYVHVDYQYRYWCRAKYGIEIL